MLFGIGLFVSGASRLFASQARGLVFIVLGTLATGVVRPHVSAILLVALVVGIALKRGGRGSPLGPLLTLATILLIAAGAAFASGQIAELLPDGC